MTTQKLSSKCPSNENITTLANHLQLCSWHPSLGNKLFSKWPRARSNDYFSDIDWRQFLAEIFLVFTSHLYVPFDYLSVSFCMIMWESSTRIVIEAFNLHTFSSDKPSLRHCVRHQLVLFLVLVFLLARAWSTNLWLYQRLLGWFLWGNVKMQLTSPSKLLRPACRLMRNATKNAMPIPGSVKKLHWERTLLSDLRCYCYPISGLDWIGHNEKENGI